jgi:2-hydroxy-3-oxopropionate reductase
LLVDSETCTDATNEGATQMRVAFIGLGNMGLPMATHLIDADFDVVGFDLDEDRTAAFEEAGGDTDDDIDAAVRDADVVITMVRTPEQVLSICDGLFSEIPDDSLFVDMSTVGPETIAEVREQASDNDVRVLDAPVSGGVEGAKDGSLAIMVGGRGDDFAMAEPLFEAMGESVVHVGDSGAGQTAKLCNQLLVGAQLASIAEAFRLADAAGIDLDTLYEVLTSGIANSGILEVKGERILNDDYEPGANVDLQHKDTQLIMDLGESLDVPLYSTSIVAQAFIHARNRDLGDKDHLILYNLFDEEP